ncbi:hypothetical protein CPB86DRAFT_779615 [Serendipita vermifera]|nr:hypothetical protein CPB86DRAFT_779615 [Serendipita vermifera]
MSDAPANALAARSPSSRKSLSAVSTTHKPNLTHRKRAKSIASANPEDLTPRSKRRRSLVPKKSILKQSNFGNAPPTLQELTMPQSDYRPPQLDEMTFNFTRTSAFNPERRVSFAPNAHVRLIPKDTQNNNDLSSPTSSPTNSAESSPDTSKENADPQFEPSPLKKYHNSRRSSIRQSLGEGEGEQSMDLASDASFVEEGESGSPASGFNRRESGVTEGSSMDTDDSQADMDITMNTNVTGRLSMSRRRSSTRPRPSSSNLDGDDKRNEKVTEYTVTLEESLKGEVQPSANWLALKAVMNSHDDTPSSPPADIDIETAAKRILKAGQDIPLATVSEGGEEDMTISSGGDTTGSIGGKTMDFTALTGGIRRHSMNVAASQLENKDAQTESQVSLPTTSVSAATTGDKSIFSQNANPPSSTTPASSIFRSKVSSSLFTPRAASSSPVKGASSPIKAPVRPKAAFTAAFAPPSAKGKGPAFTMSVPTSLRSKSPARETPSKRPYPNEAGAGAAQSPSKKLIIAVDGESRPTAIPRPSSKPDLASSPIKRITGTQQKYLNPTRTPLAATPTLRMVTPAKSPQKVSTPAHDTSAPATPIARHQISQPVTPSAHDGSAPPTPAEEKTERVPSEIGASSPAPLPSEVSSPKRTPQARRSLVETALTTSPWLSQVKRPSLISLVQEDDEERDGHDDYDVTNILDHLSEEVRERLPRSVDELLRLVGGEFMDNMAARRRSTMALRAKDQYRDQPLSLADYATAIIVDFPQLSYLDFIVKHLDAHNDQLDENQKQTDQAVLENPPPCFIDYAAGGPEQLPELKMMLETLRSLVRSKTKLQWYRWRLEGINDLYRAVDIREKEALQDLAQTQALAAEVTTYSDQIEQEHRRIMAELEQERAAVSEIEKCDPKALAEVKSSIADYATQLKMLEEEITEIQNDIEGTDQLADNYRGEQKSLQQRSAQAERTCSTQNCDQDIFAQTKDNVELLQFVTRWKGLKVSPSLISLEYDSSFNVRIPCQEWIPILDSCDITLIKDFAPGRAHRADWLPTFTDFVVGSAQHRLVSGKFGKRNIRRIISRLSAFWACCDVIRQEIMMLRSKYAVTLRPDHNGKRLFIDVPVLFEQSSSKVVVEFELRAKTIESWPLAAASMVARVHLSYALDEKRPINTESLCSAVLNRMQQATLADSYGVLLEACMEADALYS